MKAFETKKDVLKEIEIRLESTKVLTIQMEN